MPRSVLAMALAGLMMIGPCGQAGESESARSRLERRAAERGPIRKQIEAALAVPASVITAEAVEGARREARRSSSSSTRSSVRPLVWVLIGLVCLYAMWHEWASGWSKF
jgi:hypothetical protein